MSQWRFNDVRVTKTLISQIFVKQMPIFQIFAEILGKCDFD